MKFSFHKDQVLTTFAYEVSKALKDKMRRYHFIHIGKKDQQGNIKYHSFPRMIHFNEQDPLKVLALKLFKVLRPLLYSSGFTNDPQMLDIPEADAYSFFFNNQMMAYELVLVLKDGTRWKLDPLNH